MALSERVWQAYQTVNGKIHLRRAAADLSGWDWEEEIIIPAHESTAYPDICFDKAGEPFLAFESEDEKGKGVWVRRISIVESKRTEIIEKLTGNAYGPKCFRDPDNDVLVFYVDEASTEIRYRVQSEGWATERTIQGTIEGPKRIQNISLGKHYRNDAVKLVVAYSLSDASTLCYAATTPYPPGDGDLLAIGAQIVGIESIPAFWHDLNENSQLSIGADIGSIELINNDIDIDMTVDEPTMLHVGAGIATIIVINTEYKTLEESSGLNVGASIAAITTIPAYYNTLDESSGLNVGATISDIVVQSA